MQRRSEPLSLRTFGKFMRQAFRQFTVVAAVYVIAANLVACTLIWAFTTHDARTNALMQKLFYSHGSMEYDLSESTRAARRKMAAGVIALHDKGKKEGMEEPTNIATDLLPTIRKMKVSGDPLKLSTISPSWIECWATQLMLMFVALSLVALSGMQLFGYAYCSGTQFFLADLPWRKMWPWVLTFLLGPIFWIGMAVSAVRLFFHDKPVPERDELPAYDSDPETAARFYEELCAQIKRSDIHGKWQQAAALLDDRRQACRGLANRLRDYQKEISELTVQERTLREQLEDPPTEGFLSPEQEFQQLLAHRSVIAVGVQDGNLRIVVRAEFTHLGVTYDLGDWEILLIPRQVPPEVTRLRTTKLDSWNEHEPPYYLGNSFCFGEASVEIRRMANEGALFKAVLLMIGRLNDVNERHRLLIPKVYPAKIGG